MTYDLQHNIVNNNIDINMTLTNITNMGIILANNKIKNNKILTIVNKKIN